MFATYIIPHVACFSICLKFNKNIRCSEKLIFFFIFIRKNKGRAYRWRKKEPIVSDITCKGTAVSNPPENAEEMTSFQYLKMFWDDEICDHLVYHTNLYSTHMEL